MWRIGIIAGLATLFLAGCGSGDSMYSSSNRNSYNNGYPYNNSGYFDNSYYGYPGGYGYPGYYPSYRGGDRDDYNRGYTRGRDDDDHGKRDKD